MNQTTIAIVLAGAVATVGITGLSSCSTAGKRADVVSQGGALAPEHGNARPANAPVYGYSNAVTPPDVSGGSLALAPTGTVVQGVFPENAAGAVGQASQPAEAAHPAQEIPAENAKNPVGPANSSDTVPQTAQAEPTPVPDSAVQPVVIPAAPPLPYAPTYTQNYFEDASRRVNAGPPVVIPQPIAIETPVYVPTPVYIPQPVYVPYYAAPSCVETPSIDISLGIGWGCGGSGNRGYHTPVAPEVRHRPTYGHYPAVNTSPNNPPVVREHPGRTANPPIVVSGNPSRDGHDGHDGVIATPAVQTIYPKPAYRPMPVVSPGVTVGRGQPRVPDEVTLPEKPTRPANREIVTVRKPTQEVATPPVIAPTNVKPTLTAPAQVKVIDIRPVEIKPMQVRPAEIRQLQPSRPVEIKPAQVKKADTPQPVVTMRPPVTAPSPAFLPAAPGPQKLTTDISKPMVVETPKVVTISAVPVSVPRSVPMAPPSAPMQISRPAALTPLMPTRVEPVHVDAVHIDAKPVASVHSEPVHSAPAVKSDPIRVDAVKK